VHTLSFGTRPLVDQRPKALLREVESRLEHSPRSLFERVQDVDRFSELCDVQHSMLDVGMNANLWTPSPTLGIGFQSFGSSPRWTRQS
jgi:hypothetical protein